MKRHVPHDCAACADLRVRVGELEQRVAALEPLRPRLRLVNDETPLRTEAAPDWPSLPRARGVRVDAAHPLQVPHPLLMTIFASARDGTAYHRDADAGTVRPRVLDRVA